MMPTTFGGVTGMVTLSVDGGVWSESAVATLTSVVAENSAAVTVWLPEQFIVAVGASVAGWGGVHVSDATLVSLRVTPVRVVLPVFVTTNVYGTTWPTAVMTVVVEAFLMVNAGFLTDGTSLFPQTLAAPPAPSSTHAMLR